MAGRLSLFPSVMRADLSFGGTMRLRGTVNEFGVAGVYVVQLYHKTRAELVRQVLSDNSGYYEFQRIGEFPQFVVAFDHGDNPVNAAISDQLILEPMP